jgi:MFS family permease
MRHLDELRANWRSLASAALGLACGCTLTNFTNNIFAPHLIREFGWSKADFALIGVAILIGTIGQPLGGRLADAFGVRRVALFGVAAGCLAQVAFIGMSGRFLDFFLITVVQFLTFGGATSVVIYSGLIRRSFGASRGLALGLASSAPALAGAALAPALAAIVEAWGWRAGYVALAGLIGVGGLAALALVPAAADPPPRRAGPERSAPAFDGWGVILRSPALPVMLGATFLCNLTLSVQFTQLKLILLDAGAGAAASSAMISLYACGVIVGRVLCGLALDRFPAHGVAVVVLGLPAVGLAILASSQAQPALLALSVALIGLSLGAEGDVGAFLVMRFFPPGVYATVLGLMIGAMSLSGAAGAVILSLLLKATGGFGPFLGLAAAATLVGSALFPLLARLPRPVPAASTP